VNVDLASQDSLLQEFLKASDAAQSQRELREMEHRVTVERRTSQRLRRLTFALIVVSLLAIGLAGLAFRQGAVARANEAKALRNAELAVSEQQTAVAGSTEVAKAYEIAEASLATQAASLELQLSASSSLTSTSTTPNAEAIATTAAIETQLMEIRATQTAVVTLPPAFDPDLIAMYTLENNAEDKTEKNNDITLQNAPFQEDGGVYCNGVYAGDNRCLIMTPQLNSFDYDSFSISMQFKVTEFKTQPVFVGGNGWRWIGYYLNDDGTVSLLYNNSNREACGGEYELNKWHTADVTYDGKEARLYLDSFLRCTIPFDLEHGNDKNVTTSNFSNGQAFKGIIRELRIYNKVISPLNIEPLSQRDPRWSNLRLGQAGSTRTIGDWGPLLVSMTMLANSFDKDITPSDLNASFIRQGGYLDTNLLKWNALSNVYSDIIYMGKISDQTELLIRIDESLANGNPVIAQVDFTPDTPYDDDDQHWVLIVRKDGDDYRINDPWLYPAEESSLIDQYGRPSELDEPVVLSAIFYRSISQ
jgi:hypothetical protein